MRLARPRCGFLPPSSGVADYPYCWPWPLVRAEVLDRDGYRCQIKGPKCKGTATCVDHIIPWAEGHDPYDKANLRAACQPCNQARVQARLAAMAKLNRQQPTTPSRQW